MKFYVSNGGAGQNNVMTLLGGGNVGIGTSAPQAKVDIVSNGNQEIRLTDSRSVISTSGVEMGKISWYSKELSMPDHYGALAELRVVSNDGSVDPDGRFEFRPAYNGALTTRMVIEPHYGRVGIGTTNPGYLLEVEDNANGGFVMQIKNTANSNESMDKGLLISAGHDSYSSGTASDFIRFETPSGNYCGRIKQHGNTSVDYFSASDRRLKENIRPTRFGLENLLKIEVRDFTFTSDPSHVQTGFIAQQLYTAYSPAVGVGGNDPATNPWEVAYGSLTPLLVQAVQDQQEIIEAQQTEIEALKAKADEVDVLKAEIDNIKSVLGIDSELTKNK